MMYETELNDAFADINYIQEQAGEQTKHTILKAVKTIEGFPTAFLAKDGQLVEIPAVIIEYGHPPIKQPFDLPPYPPKSGLILTPEGLFFTSCERANVPNSSAFVEVPSINNLKEAFESEYREHGARVLIRLRDKLETASNLNT